jgi:enoyl-CoA hydratase
MSSIGTYDNVIAEVRGKSGLITLNRPKVNAASDGLLQDVIAACKAFDSDSRVGAVVITGNDKFFCGGADIKEMENMTYAHAISTNMFADWDFVAQLNKPIIAAVNGYALGGGCELAMMCDLMVCGDNAKFGQPEIKLGVIPGCGGTQRLIRAIGKAKAMDMVLTGKMINADEALSSGLVSRVFPTAELVDGALKIADEISSFSKPVTAIAKETVNAAHELSLAEGLRLERRLFHSLFALDDQKEGMGAFVQKRAPNFTDK